jgi:hypothetical protein
MKRLWVFGVMAGVLVLSLGTGCVERRLKINTSPQGAMVTLNDEQIGVSPVTVTFLWYGDYAVRLAKEEYQTLDTHRALKAPWYDAFPFDFFAQILWPGRIVDSYEWTFELQSLQPVLREDLIQRGLDLEKQLNSKEP